MKPRQRYDLCISVAFVKQFQGVQVEEPGQNAIAPYIGQYSEFAVLIGVIRAQLVTKPVSFYVLIYGVAMRSSSLAD
jgi:hypothetical protein